MSDELLFHLLLSFLVPIAIYDNTIEVLEYSTNNPQYLIGDESKSVYWFNIQRTNSTILQMQVDDFNYIDKVTNPFHHISLMFSNGYYDQRNEDGKKLDFYATFLPIVDDSTVLTITKENNKTFFVKDKFEHHSKIFSTVWNQSGVNYSWWHIAFYSCIVLIGYAMYNEIRNKTQFPKETIFLFCGIVSFFIPYLFLSEMRDSYSYYMIYYLPIMAFGLVTILYKIPRPRIRLLVIVSFCIAVLANFALSFPVRF